MFFSNQYHSLDQISIEDIKSSTYELSTAVHNSPKTAKFKFINEDQTTLNCSFDEGGQSGYAQKIVDASLVYLQQSLHRETFDSDGFNDQSLYEQSLDNSVVNQKTFDQLILGNGNLTIQQKHQFIMMLRRQSELMDLFNQLSYLFNLNIFQQVSYLIFKIWEKRDELLLSNLESDPFHKFTLPRFDCFINLQNGQTFPSVTYVSYKQKKTYEQVKKEAEECSHSFADQMFYDAKIKLLSLRECKKKCQNENIVRSSFRQLFKILTSSIYLSLQGFFCQSADSQNIFVDSNVDSQQDFDIRSNYSLEQFIPSFNFHSRKLSQFSEKDGGEEDQNSSGRKKRKLW